MASKIHKLIIQEFITQLSAQRHNIIISMWAVNSNYKKCYNSAVRTHDSQRVRIIDIYERFLIHYLKISDIRNFIRGGGI